MRKRAVFRVLALAWLMGCAVSASSTDRLWPRSRRPKAEDTLRIDSLSGDMRYGSRMLGSLYPVSMQVRGRALQVESGCGQILPIYTRSGAFYMAVRLNKGTNWVNGLPRGEYFINHRPVTIN